MSLEKLKAFLSLMEKISPSSCNTVAVIVKYQQDKAFSQEIDVLFQTLLSSDSGTLPQQNTGLTPADGRWLGKSQNG